MPTEVPTFYLVEWLKVYADLAAECLECEHPWPECLTCGVTECEREIAGWLRY